MENIEDLGSKNVGQIIDPASIRAEECWVGTVYDNGGFDYKIEPINLEVQNQEEIEKRVEAGETREVILDELANEYIKYEAGKLGIDPSGYVSPSGRIYISATDPKIGELEAV